MRKFQADKIFPVTGRPVKNGIIVTDDAGHILDIYENRKNFGTTGLERYEGIIVPGFINVHSHLEYAYIKDLIEPGQSLEGFIRSIIKIKQTVPVDYDKIVQADEIMAQNGIVAVGDHTNTLITKDIKLTSQIYYHSFIELYKAISEINSPKADFEHGLAYLKALENQGSITPHAPYSVSPELMRMIANYAFLKKTIISIHNQETEAEREMFLYGTGKFAELFVDQKFSHNWIPTGTSSIEWFLPFFHSSHNLLLIHNVYTTRYDLEFAENTNQRLFWVMCPGSNLYIENRLPDIPMFRDSGVNIALGTDSYASNTKLSILYEMQILQENFEIPFDQLLQWATINGAKALELDHIFGSLESGKRPGLVLLQNIDADKLEINENTTIKKLI